MWIDYAHKVSRQFIWKIKMIKNISKCRLLQSRVKTLEWNDSVVVGALYDTEPLNATVNLLSQDSMRRHASAQRDYNESGTSINSRWRYCRQAVTEWMATSHDSEIAWKRRWQDTKGSLRAEKL